MKTSRAKGTRKVETLLLRLVSPDLEMRCTAALKLGRMGGLEAIAPLEQAIFEHDPTVEYCARAALDQVRLRLAATGGTCLPERLDELHKKLESPYLEERAQAIRELSLWTRDESLTPLIACLEQETDPLAIALLVRGILAFRKPASRDVMIRFMGHSEPRVRAAAVEGFWEWADPEVVTAVIQLLKDPSPKVRGPVFVFLVRRGGSPARSLAAKLLASQGLWMRLAAIYALGGMVEPWARQTVTNHIRDPKQPPLLRTLAREAIVLSGVPADAGAASTDPSEGTVWTDLTRHLPAMPDQETLGLALQNKDPLTRIHGLQNAGRFPAEVSLPILKRLAQWETDSMVLATLVKALARVGGPDEAEAIRKFLVHDDSRVRSNALEALSLVNLGPELDAICKQVLLEDEAPRMQKQAAAHLFATDPEEAIRHFRGMLLGEDLSARENALSILTTLQDERLLGVLRDALKDPRREVYGRSYEALRRVAAGWDKARALLESYQRGVVAGEVVDGEPVSALLFAMNSPKSADRIRAMGKLVYADDARVNVVLELNLSSRDPDVAREAPRPLTQRPQAFTLPRLYRRLGELFLERFAQGMTLAPQALTSRLVSGVEALDPADVGEQERLMWVGKSLFDAFEEDADLDPEVRSVCLDVRTALDQIGSTVGPRESKGETVFSRAAGATQALEAPERAPAASPEPPPAESPVSRRRAFNPLVPWAVAVAGLLVVGGLTAWVAPWEWVTASMVGAGDEDPAATPERSMRLLDAMALESRPDRFAEKFKDRQVVFQARIVQVNGPTSATLRSGSVLFNLTSPRPSQVLQTLRPGQACEVTATVQRNQSDGSIDLEGDVRQTSGP